MKITYIHHSSFCVELENSILLFDYFKGELPKFDTNKKLYVFASHFHEDHFDKCIFDIQNVHPDVTYILSKDIKRHRSKYIKAAKNSVIVNFDENISIDDMKIKTLESSDIGVAFLIEIEGKVIYHAGDLNWWHWEGENSNEENKYAENKFKDGIDKIKGLDIDLAFVPLDPRQGDFYYLGFNYFMENTNTKVAFPMHMWGDFSLCKTFKSSEYAKDYKDRVIEISKDNQVFDI
ncbi:MAG: MBL fold metallo-hydrolase [Intestinibacter sp.]|uniref:MBL fold metallo-hydrolase n=1 Tax=Intestinibacter sp. TaxID=1965304 RepID=UPI002A7F463B|nr:MBL fold metallo-hydrolase [Intestinibacter sp.]MDY4573912.1 MBL fold metallo-hydrolase [Intestinibacter sp.]